MSEYDIQGVRLTGRVRANPHRCIEPLSKGECLTITHKERMFTPSNIVYRCKNCAAIFATADELGDHMREEDPELSARAERCGYCHRRAGRLGKGAHRVVDHAPWCIDAGVTWK